MSNLHVRPTLGLGLEQQRTTQRRGGTETPQVVYNWGNTRAHLHDPEHMSSSRLLVHRAQALTCVRMIFIAFAAIASPCYGATRMNNSQLSAHAYVCEAR
jgi:hypothetical protein